MGRVDEDRARLVDVIRVFIHGSRYEVKHHTMQETKKTQGLVKSDVPRNRVIRIVCIVTVIADSKEKEILLAMYVEKGIFLMT